MIGRPPVHHAPNAAHPHQGVMSFRHRGGTARIVAAPMKLAVWTDDGPTLPAGCVPDGSNPTVIAIATGIVYRNDPVPWTNGGEYALSVDGSYYVLVMAYVDAKRAVLAYRCVPDSVRDHFAQPRGYMGDAENTIPADCGEGWMVLTREAREAHDQTFAARASEMMSELPCWSYRDEWLGSGLYRWFKYENAAGTSCGCAKYTGTSGDDVLPQEQQEGTIDPVSDSNSTKGSGGEIIPVPDATCLSWAPTIAGNITDESTPTGIANAISYHNRPVPWADQTVYAKTINGVRWKFVMYSAGGKRMVSTFKCTAQRKAPSLSVQGSAWWIIAALVALALVGGGVAMAHEKKHTRHAA